VSFVELPIAYDGIAIVVNPRATWISDITVQELKKVWEPDARGKIVRWNQIREEWPDRELHLFGADVESGTYDYFTAAISGVEGSSRSDFTASADDEVLVQAIARDELALAFLPLVYYEKNKHRLKPVAIDNEDGDDGVGPIAPSVEAIRNGTYQPLARPIFLYARAQALNRASVGQFIDFYLARAGALAARLGYMPLDPSAYALVAERRKARWTGTVFGEGGSQVGLTVAQLLEKARIP
jgi:phosphate transport system substrate-binding protein